MSTQALLSGICVICLSFNSISIAQTGSDETLEPSQLTRYATVELTSDLSHLSSNQQKMLVSLIRAGQQMDKAFWYQAFGDPNSISIDNQNLRRHFEINYGPWDRLKDNRPFISGIGAKPAGANFYPPDMTQKRFETFVSDHPDSAKDLKSLYTIVRRDDSGNLVAIPYSKQFNDEFKTASEHLVDASKLAKDEQFKAYLLARSKALLSDEYRESDMLWMDMKNNPVDIVIGPVETYEDQLFGYKAACTCYVLIKDLDWSQRLSKYANLLPGLQRGLPVPDEYKKETPGTDSDLNAYDVIYYAGDCNAGSKTIAINLPNDEEVQLQKGTRRLQLKNAMRAKFDKILEPLAEMLIVPDQRQHITFDAFFANTMFHEVAHGLGIKYTIKDGGRVRESLRELASALEEGKADVLGLYMVTQLLENGELTQGQIENYYVTFMASIFRSVRFGASSAHGRANILRFNFFNEHGAFAREESGQYRIDMDKMKSAMRLLSQKILTLQGDGDYEAASRFMDEYGLVGPTLQADLERVNRAGIPTDIIFKQGVDVLGLNNQP